MRSFVNRFFGLAINSSRSASSTTRRAGEARGVASPALEALESRQMLAVVVWDGGPTGTATDFNTAANWVGDVLPGPADTAVINTAGNTITFTSGTRTITNLETSRDISFNGGSLVTSGTNTITAVLRMQGGTLNGGIWNLSGFGQFSFTTSGGTLANLTTTAELNIGVQSAGITLSGTTTTGNIRLSGNNTNLNLAPGFTLNSNVIAEGAGSSTRSITTASGGAGTVTIAPSSTITLGISSGSGLILQQSSVATLINNGLIVNENASQTLTINVPAFTNAGTLRATTGNLTVSSTGGWLNTGTIEAAAAGIVNLGGTFNATSGEGTFATFAGQLNLTGTLTNTGNTFDLSPTTTGNLRIVGGTINNGFVNATSGATILGSVSNGTLNSVAIAGEVTLGATSVQITLSGSTTFTAVRMSAGNTTVNLAPGFTLSNPIIGEGAATGTRDVYVAFGGAGTVTISSTGSITAASGVGAGVRLLQSSVGTLVNNGLIVNQAAGRTIQITSLNTFTNAATGIVRATAGTVSIGANNWTNAGTIENTAGSTIALAGTFNTSGGIGTFSTEPGNVLVTGTVNNAGGSITLNASTGDWTMSGGTISGGTLNTTGFALNTSNALSTLTNLAVTGDLLMNVVNGQLLLTGTTTFTTLRMSAGNTTLYLAPGYTLNNPIIGEGAATGLRDVYVAFGGAGTMTIASGGSVTAASGIGADVRILQSSTATLINNGLIVNQAAGRNLQIYNPATFTNSATGIVRASAGSVTIGASATNWTNAGTIENVLGSSIILAGTFSTAGGIGTFNTEPGSVVVTGTINNVGGNINLNATTGDWALQGGTISGGSMAYAGNLLTTTTAFSTLHNVAITGEVIMATSSSQLQLSGSTTFTALRMTGSNVTLYLVPGYTLNSPIIAEGAATGSRDIYVAYGGTGSMTIASTGSITAASGLGADLRIQQSSAANVTNNGLIVNQATGRTLNIQNPATFTNAATGIVRAAAGTVNIGAASWTNAGTIENVAGSSINVGGTFNTAGGIGTFNTAAGEVFVTGTINNVGNTITLNSTTGDWTMSVGTISGGSLILSGVTLNTTSSGGTLASVAITGEVILGVSSAQLILSGTTSFTALRMSGGNSILYTAPGYTLSSPIIAEGAATGTRDIYVAYGGTGTTTITSTGSMTSASGSGADLRILQSSVGTLVNNGLITIQATGRTLLIQPGTFTNNAGGIVRSSVGNININATNWTNAGSLQVSPAAFIQLNGNWNTTAGEGTLSNSGGTFFIDGTITNTGNTFELNTATGSLVLRSGAIVNGAMTFANGSAVLGSTSLGFLRSVAITGELNLNVANTNLGIGGTTTFTAFRLSASNSQLYVEPGTTIASPIFAEGAATGARSIVMNYGGSGAITIAPTGSIRNVAGLGADLNISQSSSSNYFNSGVISSEAPGRTLNISGTNFTNNADGSLNSLAGTLRTSISGGFINLGTVTATGGATVVLDSNINATGGLGVFNTAAGVVNIAGTVNNTGNTITTNSASGSFNLTSAIINGGSVSLLNGTTLNLPSGFSTLNNVTVNGDIVVTSSASVLVGGTTAFTALRLTGNSSGVYFPPGATLNSPVTIEGASTGSRNVIAAYGATGSFTIGPSGSIRILAGSGGGVNFSQSSTVTAIVNNGLISSEAVGRSFNINMPNFTNNATLRASGGTVDMNVTAQFINTGTIDLGPGGLLRVNGTAGFANGASGVVNVTLGGPAVTQYGRIQSTSANIQLDGTLNLTIPNNVTIPIVSRFDLITVPGNRTISGDFSTINQLPPGPDGKNFFLISPTFYSFAYSSLADFNSDAVVDLFDYLDFVAAFAANDPTADFNNDFAIDFFDYLDFLVIFSRF
ncbi:MAG: hypothetical protein KGS45_02680 [Planctomycetes bacterium]|nr:hypothetical protein [Planctomycetota bacterium]